MNNPELPGTALIIFAKRPHPGQGKQRLANEIGVDKAFQAAEILLQLTLNIVENWKSTLIISPSDQSDSEWACELAQRAVIVIPQKTGSLGQRLQQIDHEVRMLGYTKLIFIGSDAPLLKLEDIEAVQASLDNYDQIFIPASDGGVVLMASRVPWSGLTQVKWSTEKVFPTLKSLAIQQGLCFQIKPEQTDLDDLKSFTVLKPELIKQQNNSLIKDLLVLMEPDE